MKKTQIIMGMPITLTIVDSEVKEEDIHEVFNYFRKIDARFSTYKKKSEISKFNKKEINEPDLSTDMRLILSLADETKKETNGYFDIHKDGEIDTSGIVKGWAIQNAVNILLERGYRNFMVDAGGDIQTNGRNHKGNKWQIAIGSPFVLEQTVKVFSLSGEGIATSGNYIRGSHIYNPYNTTDKLEDIVSLTVIGDSVYDADRFATAAFAMGRNGINFIENMYGFEGYMIDKNGIGIMTSGLDTFVV